MCEQLAQVRYMKVIRPEIEPRALDRQPRADSAGVVAFVGIGPIRFLSGCRKRRLNQG